MRALTVEPGRAGTARLDDISTPRPSPGEVVIAGVAVGICGTDREIVDGAHGEASQDGGRLVLGHEAVGRVIDPGTADIAVGRLVVPMVREPDPVPCAACAGGEWDLCTNGHYREHGIRQLDGFARERWCSAADRLIEVPDELGEAAVLVEPASVVAKAWERIDRFRATMPAATQRVLVTGAGPIGLLAALLAVDRGLDVHVLDVVTDGPKPDLVTALGATYHHEGVEQAAAGGVDVVVECTGVGSVVIEVVGATMPNGIVCLTGLTSGTRTIPVDVGCLGREMVLENDVVFGSVSANRRHYERAVDALAAADAGWLASLITRCVPLSRWNDALTLRSGDVKVVIDLA